MIDELKLVLIVLGAKAARELLEEVECDGCCEECHLDYHCWAIKEIASNYEKALVEWQEIMNIRRSFQLKMMENVEKAAKEGYDSE